MRLLLQKKYCRNRIKITGGGDVLKNALNESKIIYNKLFSNYQKNEIQDFFNEEIIKQRGRKSDLHNVDITKFFRIM